MVIDIDDVQGKEFGRQFLGPCNQMHTFPAVMIRSNIKQPFINRYRKLFKFHVKPIIIHREIYMQRYIV